jgi:hypothetical protein
MMSSLYSIIDKKFWKKISQAMSALRIWRNLGRKEKKRYNNAETPRGGVTGHHDRQANKPIITTQTLLHGG